MEFEEELSRKVMPYLEKGRINWDKPHTLATVYWIKQLLKHEKGNYKVLVSSAYLHDIGYCGMFEAGYTRDQVLDTKEYHMKKGAEIARETLNELDYTQEEIDEIVHLVSVHDKWADLKTNNEVLLAEADCLGQIDVGRVEPVFNKQDYLKFVENEVKKVADMRIRTQTGKRFFAELMKKVEQYIENL